MNVQELIDELEDIEDKTKEVKTPVGEIVSVDELTTGVLLADE